MLVVSRLNRRLNRSPVTGAVSAVRMPASDCTSRANRSGYVLGFGVLAALQTLVQVGAVAVFLEVTFEHSVALVVLIALMGALTALGIGIVLSLFAESEFQVQQFLPLVIAPQVMLGEVYVPIEEIPWYLAYPARLMPVTSIVGGLEYAVLGRGDAGEFRVAVAALATFAAASILLAATVVRRVE